MKRGIGLFLLFLGAAILGSISRGSCERIEREGACNGSIAECHEEEELLMESEISRRFLAGNDKYITYPALGRDKAGAGGKSEPGQPYNRGCKKIYGCRGDES